MDERESALVVSTLWRSPYLRRALWTLGLTVVLTCTAWLFLSRVSNPSWINHLVIIRHDLEHEPPLIATLWSDDGKAETIWSQELQISRRRGAKAGRSKLVVANIDGAWLNGHLTITDGNGIEWANVEVSAPGRYCGTLVILIDDKKVAHAIWNGLPPERGPED